MRALSHYTLKQVANLLGVFHGTAAKRWLVSVGIEPETHLGAKVYDSQRVLKAMDKYGTKPIRVSKTKVRKRKPSEQKGVIA